MPNSATLQVNALPPLRTEPVRVKVPLGTVILTKEVEVTAGGETSPLPPGVHAGFDLYRQKGDAPDAANDMRIGYYRTAEDSTLSVTDLLPGKYYFIETVTPAGYLAASGEQRFEITADRTDPVTLTVLNQKPAVPKIGKAVSADGENWQENPLELRQPTDIFAYRITVPTALTNGWTGFAITDELDPQLELVNAAGTAYGTEADHDLSAFVTITPELEPDQFALSLDDNNLLTFRYLGNDVAQGVPGTEAVLTFRVRVKDLEAFLKAHPDGKVTNRAAVQTGDQLSGNRVTSRSCCPAVSIN